MKFALALSVMLLAACTGFNHVSFNPDGSPKSMTQSDAFLAKGQSSARSIRGPNGWEMQSVQQNYDAASIGEGIIDAKTTLGLGRFAAQDRAFGRASDSADAANGRAPLVIPGTANAEGIVGPPTVVQPAKPVLPKQPKF